MLVAAVIRAQTLHSLTSVKTVSTWISHNWFRQASKIKASQTNDFTWRKKKCGLSRTNVP